MVEGEGPLLEQGLKMVTSPELGKVEDVVTSSEVGKNVGKVILDGTLALERQLSLVEMGLALKVTVQLG